MPADQRGEVWRTKTRGWAVRWRVPGAGRQRESRSGFESKTAALRYFRDEVRPTLGTTSSGVLDARSLTLAGLADRYLQAHSVRVEPSTIRTLRERLARALAAFGDVPLAELERAAPSIAAWTATLPPGSRYAYAGALRQVLDAAVEWGVIGSNPAKRAGRNPAPKREEIRPLTRGEVERLAVELGVYGPLVRFAAETGLRPSEWIALEWRDVDRGAGVVVVERSHAKGRLHAYGKTARSRRRVPLSTAAAAALDGVPRRLDSPLVFAAPAGGYLDLGNWRGREWRPAVDAAGLEPCVPYVLRHTFATHALAAGFSLYELARYMGTSARVIDATYGHLAHGSDAAARAKLDAWAAAEQ